MFHQVRISYTGNSLLFPDVLIKPVGDTWHFIQMCKIIVIIIQPELTEVINIPHVYKRLQDMQPRELEMFKLPKGNVNLTLSVGRPVCEGLAHLWISKCFVIKLLKFSLSSGASCISRILVYICVWNSRSTTSRYCKKEAFCQIVLRTYVRHSPT